MEKIISNGLFFFCRKTIDSEKRIHFHNSTMAVSSHSFDKNIHFSWKRINFEQKYKRLGANLINVNNFKQTTDEYKKGNFSKTQLFFIAFCSSLDHYHRAMQFSPLTNNKWRAHTEQQQ